MARWGTAPITGTPLCLSQPFPSGSVVLGVFAPDGPETCSGLPVNRYAANDLATPLGESFEQRLARTDEHVTPRGLSQPFTWAAFERRR